MKKGISILCLLTFVFGSTVFAQSTAGDLSLDVYTVPAENDAAHPCITEAEYALLETRIADHRRMLGLDRMPTAKVATTMLDWPLRASANLHDCGYHFIGAYVDQNTTTGAIQDWNCGTKTYDGHKGTDIGTWPFSFYKMDNSLVEVVAAAAGTIIDKHDGEFDRNCTGNNLTANYVIIQHADGSTALYWHMKSGAVTSVAIGQSVAAGDYLGVVGSSGSSSGPHLHFEVWTGSTSATRNDPYSGACNSLNGATWWNAQRPHRETALLRVTTHSTDVVMPGCPTTETLNEQSSFTLPFQGPGLPADFAKFYIFIREQFVGMSVTCTILDPQGGTYLTWNYAAASDSKVVAWAWSKHLPANSGTYTFRAEYNGTTCESTFDIVGAVGAQDYLPASTKVYPNPSHGRLIVETNAPSADAIVVRNLLGEQVFRADGIGAKTEVELHTPRGIFFYEVLAGSHVVSAGKLLVE
jgi:hypothetical protein